MSSTSVHAIGEKGAEPAALYGGQYFPIYLGTLRTDTLCKFDMYMQAKGVRSLVLYRERNLEFTEEAMQRLQENAITRLFVPSEQVQDYYHYVEDNLQDIISDSTISMEERSEVLYGSAMHLVRDILDDPRSGAVIPRSKNLVEGSIAFIFHQPAALEHLLKVSSYDYYTYTHSVNVLVFSVALGKHLGYSEQAILGLGNGALLHDIGKSMIDPAVLNFPGKLSQPQFELVKRHTIFGHAILQHQGVKNTVMLDVARHHHEKLNGNGYPDALSAEAISEFVRISTIADIFDALTTRRPYKDALTSFAALKLMRQEMQDDLDMRLFHRFVAMLGNPSH